MVQVSSRHTAADAVADDAAPRSSASRAMLGCTERRFFESGAHTTRHEIEQSSGTEQPFLIVRSTASSPLSVWSNVAQSVIDRWRSAAAGKQIASARAHVARRARRAERMGPPSDRRRALANSAAGMLEETTRAARGSRFPAAGAHWRP